MAWIAIPPAPPWMRGATRSAPLDAARQRAARGMASLDYDAFRNRLGSFLLRRGFSYGIVRDTVHAVWEELHGATPDEAEDEGFGE